MTKDKAINFLYKDWLDYKKYYKEKQDFNMKETFIEYLEREIPEYLGNKRGTNEQREAININYNYCCSCWTMAAIPGPQTKKT